jgi:hypothetical protein
MTWRDLALVGVYVVVFGAIVAWATFRAKTDDFAASYSRMRGQAITDQPPVSKTGVSTSDHAGIRPRR